MPNLVVFQQSPSVRGTPAIADAPAIAPSQQDERGVVTVTTQTFGRLRALVARGYRPEYDASDDRCLVLVHPTKKFKYRDIMLDSSGTVWWRYDQHNTVHFARWEKKQFEAFLRAVPEPTWWDYTRAYRDRICAAVLGAVVCYVLYVVVGAALSFAHGYFGWS